MIMTTFALLESVFNYSETQIIVIDSPYDDEDWTDIRQSPHDLGVTMILETKIATANGIVHEIPESIGRVVAYKPLPSQAADAKIQQDQLIDVGKCDPLFKVGKFESATSYRRANPQAKCLDLQEIDLMDDLIKIRFQRCGSYTSLTRAEACKGDDEL